MKFIEIDNVELSFNKVEILKSIYFKAEKGKITGILGSNGCGKTSLLRILFGELKPNNKLIRIDNKPILKPLYKKNMIKFLPQFHIIPGSFSLKKAFYYFDVSLNSLFENFPDFKIKGSNLFKELSGGERRVVESYLTIKSKSEIILLDEPFSHIAPLFIEKIKELITIEKENKIVIITDHLYKDILSISNDIYLLKDGWSKLLKNNDELIFYNYTNSI